MDKPIALPIAILIFSGFFLLPDTANAYVGPGAGLSLLGALWALVIAVGTALVFIFAWPIRRMRRRKREAKEQSEAQHRDAGDAEAKKREHTVTATDSATTKVEPAIEVDSTGRLRPQ